MATQLNTANHTTLNTAMTELFRSGSCSGVKMTIYTDAEATTIATDSNGNIENRKVTRILKTAEYTHPTTNTVVKPSVKVFFADNTTITATDDLHNFYYKITGEAIPSRTFGSGTA